MDEKSMRYRDISALAKSIGLWSWPIAGKRSLDCWKGYQRQAPDKATDDRWIEQYPWAGGAAPTGEAPNLIVVDADCPDALEWLNQQGLPHTWQVQTVRGVHYWFRYPAGVDVRNSASRIHQGVDIRGNGGCCVLPGSERWVLNDRKWEKFEYRWVPGHSPADCPRADCPAWLIDWFTAQAAARVVTPTTPMREYTGTLTNWARQARDGIVYELLDARNGERNDMLNRQAFKMGQLVGGGAISRAEAERCIRAVTKSWKDESIAKSESTMRCALEAGKLSPRFVPERK
jgi:hypothetical protein